MSPPDSLAPPDSCTLLQLPLNAGYGFLRHQSIALPTLGIHDQNCPFNPLRCSLSVLCSHEICKWYTTKDCLLPGPRREARHLHPVDEGGTTCPRSGVETWRPDHRVQRRQLQKHRVWRRSLPPQVEPEAGAAGEERSRLGTFPERVERLRQLCLQLCWRLSSLQLLRCK